MILVLGCRGQTTWVQTPAGPEPPPPLGSLIFPLCASLHLQFFYGKYAIISVLLIFLFELIRPENCPWF